MAVAMTVRAPAAGACRGDRGATGGAMLLLWQFGFCCYSLCASLLGSEMPEGLLQMDAELVEPVRPANSPSTNASVAAAS